MEAKLIDSILEVEAPDWNSLAGDDYPFLRHEFLSSLEQCGAVSEQTGWKTRHLLMFEDARLLAAMPLYLKYHSAGEYVFDHQWAEAYHRHGMSYYPKWLTAIPFTPCQGPRLAVKNPPYPARLMPELLGIIREMSEEHCISSWHCLFPDVQQTEWLQASGLAIREDVQFHWFNKGYRDFDDYLQSFSSSKRKMIKRERRKIREAGIELIRLKGSEVDEEQWRIFIQFYQMTYLKKGMRPYLNLDFFLRCAATMADRMLMVLALKKNRCVAAALSFIGSDTLYGRYWGCFEEFDFLHFEACYYQGLDFCIDHGLSRFDSGAQGEHKIARGFEPTITQSAHWFKEPGFADAIELFLARERKAVHNYMREAANCLPYKKTYLQKPSKN
ncbi:MAG: GNAT family N-acetyltransferase [Gammaproteobacteria bacterium]